MKKIIKQIPNMITTMNLVSGIYAIYFAFEGEYQKSLIFVLIAMLFDAMDGRTARMLKIEGDFGKEYDSLADVITFGIAPMLILLNTNDITPRDWEFVLLLIFPVAGAWRLARFNTETYKAKKHFVGLPITISGFLLTFIGTQTLGEMWYVDLITTLILSFFMVSSINVPNFKQIKFNKKIYVYVCILSMFVYLTYLVTLKYEISLIIIPIIVLIAYPINKIKRKRKREKVGIKSDTENKENVI